MAEATEVSTTPTTATEVPVAQPAATPEVQPGARPEDKPAVAPKNRSLLTLKKDETATETTETPADPAEKPAFVMPEKMVGKSAEEIAEMYVNLEKAKAGKPADVPEAYDFEGLKEHGLTIYDDQHGADTTAMLKELGMSQDQVAKAMPHWKKQAERLSKEAFTAGQKAVYELEFANPPDQAKQTAEINKEWGTQARARVDAITNYAETLPDELLNWPLKASAAGLKILERLMNEDLGPAIITESSPTDAASLQDRLAVILKSDRYKKPGPQRAAAEAEADRIAAQIAKLQQ